MREGQLLYVRPDQKHRRCFTVRRGVHRRCFTERRGVNRAARCEPPLV
jgi:hypothetical protein